MNNASPKNATLLGGRPPKARRGERRTRSELGANPLVRDFEAGPFVHLAVPPFPPELVELVERRTGRRFPAELLAEYERIRAFLDFPGVEVTPELESHRRLEDDTDRGEATTAELPGRAAHLAARSPIKTPELGGHGMPDPADLGDD